MDNQTAVPTDPWSGITPPYGPGKLEPVPCYSCGWICPRCGRGNAPFVRTCPCMPVIPIVTCGGTASMS